MIELSICIPTYNRAESLKECLDSILPAVESYRDKIEVIISDNDSADNTQGIIKNFQNRFEFIRVNKNTVNVGAPRHFPLVVGLTKGKYVWVIGDDDKIVPEAIKNVLLKIEEGYDLIILNHSVWTKNFERTVIRKIYNTEKDLEFFDKNLMLIKLGLRLAFTSSVIVKREILSITFDKYEKFLKFRQGPFFNLMSGLPDKFKAYLFARPLVLNRGENSLNNKELWYKTFAIGSALALEELRKYGYSDKAVFKAKTEVLKDYVMHDISFRRRHGQKMANIFVRLYPYYKNNWFFWAACVPMLYLPVSIIWLINRLTVSLRKGKKLLFDG